MNMRAPVAVLISLLALGCASHVLAQDGKQQRIADLAYEAEMSHDEGACPDAQTVTDRNVCLNDARVETYKNYEQFFGALREALTKTSQTDARAPAGGGGRFC